MLQCIRAPRALLALLTATALVTTVAPAASAVTVKPGKPCVKLNQRVTQNRQSYQCLRRGGRLAWTLVKKAAAPAAFIPAVGASHTWVPVTAANVAVAWTPVRPSYFDAGDPGIAVVELGHGDLLVVKQSSTYWDAFRLFNVDHWDVQLLGNHFGFKAWCPQAQDNTNPDGTAFVMVVASLPIVAVREHPGIYEWRAAQDAERCA